MSNFFPKPFLYGFFKNYDSAFECLSDAHISDDFELVSEMNPQKSTLIKLALKYRRLIWAIPGINKIATIIKNEYYVYNNPKTKILFNAEGYMHLNSVDFIRVMYKKLLDREVNGVELDMHSRFYQRGGNKGAIIYFICSSAEFNSRFEVMNIDSYKKAYTKYRMIMLLRRIPLFSAYVRAKAADRALCDMRALILARTDSITHDIAVLRNDISHDIAAPREEKGNNINEDTYNLHNRR